MKTLIAAAILGLAMVTVIFSQANSWEEDGLKGKVKHLTVERAEPAQKAGAMVEGKRRPVETASYSPAGQKIEETHYSAGGALLWTFAYTYDPDGMRISTQCRLANGSVSEKLAYAYKHGKKVESDTFAPDGSLREKSSFAYDESGNVAEVDGVGADGTSFGKWTYRYDDKGHVRDWTSYTAEGTLFEESTYTYDSEGRLKVSAQYRADNSLEKRVTYDSKGNEIEAEKDAPDATVQSKRRYEYDFDQMDNWTRKVTKEQIGTSGKSSFVTVETEYRAIEYY
ncbi:MAG: hypothetical protein ABSG17_08585 [Spirochaetia bacterium]|jgi:hypothetical protein